ncbi:MAG: sensor histidine kinase [Alphaproteobacteria bacterium]|nr:sensor histidine kinase [Alphaproteobacteria bacterium]
MMRHSLRIRLTILAAAWTILALVAGGLVLSFAFRQTVENAFDQRLDDIQLGVISGVEAQPDGTLAMTRPLIDQRFSQVFSGWYWQISDGQTVLLRSRSLWDQELENTAVGAIVDGDGPGYLRGPRERKLRSIAAEITIPRRAEPLVILVAADISETRREVRSFNALLAISLGLLGVGLIVAILLQVTLGLRPLQRLRNDLDRIRAGEAGKLDDGYPAEIHPLVEAMNAVLEHNSEMVRRARAHAGDLAHGLKTPLSILKGESTDFDPEKSARIDRQIDTMSRLIDHHLTRAAATGTASFTAARTEVLPVATEIRTSLLQLFAEQNLEISLSVSPDLYFRGEREDLEEMIGNLMENACKWAQKKICVTAMVENNSLRINVVDDGPGLSDDESKSAVERGRRFDSRNSGSGLGLAIVSDISALYGGEISLQRSKTGGLQAILELPAAT